MQDKNIDQLFKDRFDSLESEPSADLWGKITAQLDEKPGKKKAFAPFWMAAASVIILASAVLWLYKPVEVIKLHPNVQNQVASNQQSMPEAIVAEEIVAERIVTDAIIAAPRKVEIAGAGETKRTKFKPQVKQTPNHTIKATEEEGKLILVAQNTKPVAGKPDIVQVAAENPVVIAQIEESREDNSIPGETGRQKIKSIGGLVNFVVAQVDKRENKIIEFTEGEEGSEVSGINLGVLKFKSRNK